MSAGFDDFTCNDLVSQIDSTIKSKLQEHGSDTKAAIFGHPFPDPDSIGSQMGLAWLLAKKYQIESDLYFEGEISHPQNSAIINLLELNLIPAQNDYQIGKYSLNFLVDTTPKNLDGVSDVPWDLVIDHHKENQLPNFDGHFLHRKIGSCSAILVELISSLQEKDQDLWFSQQSDYDRQVATGLMAGIATDTEHNMSMDATDGDFHAYNRLYPYRLPLVLKDIIYYKRPKSWVDMISRASNEAVVDTEGFAIVGLGMVSEKNRDVVPYVADEMIKWASVEAAVAFAVVGCNKLVGCVRSGNASVSVNDLCKKLGGTFGSGGAKLGKGSYNYGFGGLCFDPDDEADHNNNLWLAIKHREISRITKTIKG